MLIKNMNDLAREVTLREGGKVNLSIAQVKEVLGHLSDVMYQDIRGTTEGSVLSISAMLRHNGERRLKKGSNK